MWNGLKHLGFYVGFGQYLCDLGHFSLELFSSSVEWGGWKTGLLGPLPTSVLHYSISLKLPSSFVLFFFILRGSQESNSTFVIMTVIWKMMIYHLFSLTQKFVMIMDGKALLKLQYIIKVNTVDYLNVESITEDNQDPSQLSCIETGGCWVWGNKQKGHLV